MGPNDLLRRRIQRQPAAKSAPGMDREMSGGDLQARDKAVWNPIVGEPLNEVAIRTFAVMPKLDREDIMRLRRYLALGLALWPMATSAQPLRWVRYEIPETGASVDIPKSIFSEDAGKPETGYGGRFLSPDRRANLTVQSVPNTDGSSPAAFLVRRNPPRDITYKRITSRFFVVSSFRQRTIWYDRCNFAGRFINCVLINYPEEEKRQWDEIVTRISKSLASR
jgi:hypothetical protein